MSVTSVPLLDLAAQNHPLRPQLMEEASGRIIDTGRFILGPDVERPEADIAKIGAKHVIGVSSGTDALLVADLFLQRSAVTQGHPVKLPLE